MRFFCLGWFGGCLFFLGVFFLSFWFLFLLFIKTTSTDEFRLTGNFFSMLQALSRTLLTGCPAPIQLAVSEVGGRTGCGWPDRVWVAVHGSSKHGSRHS